ncbi:MAG: hypothetical protein JO197_01260 [Acidobacteria bacterium]|nr:hypothetical protein [Acidobacteriota bacterium]MBV9476257.1 hypothetical protein [Acidobacteriota bacterium]
MRIALIILIVLALIAGGLAAYLAFTTPHAAAPLRMPLTNAQRALLAHAGADADTLAYIPRAAVLRAKLLANPVTRDAVERWTSAESTPPPWLLGGADVVLWHSEKRTSYAVRLDALRAWLARAWLSFATNADARWDGDLLLMNAPVEPMIGDAALAPILQLASGLPEGDVFIVQREGGRGAFPPIARPAVSSVRVAASDLVVVSRANADETNSAPHAPVVARFPRGALLSATFAAPPRILGDVRRLLLGIDIQSLVDDGGSIALYDVDAGTLLPRPNGVIVIPANEKTRAAVDPIVRAAELVGETRDTGSELLVAVDRTSLPLYLKDTFVPATWPANGWALRIDPKRFVPLLGKLGDNTGLRFAAPRIHRAARDLRRWIGALEQAEAIEAADSVNGGVEELRVRVASK